MIKTQIVDGFGKGNKLKINGEGELAVVQHTHPPIEEDITSLPFRQYFTDNGFATGSNDMRVDGSTNNVQFSIKASQDKDIFIKTLSIVIADANSTLNSFGNIGALANGVEFYWFNTETDKIEIHEGLTTNFEFVRLGVGQPSFGNTTNAFRASNVAGTSEGYIPTVDLATTFGLPWGIRLRKATTDKLVFNVRDNITAVDAFNIIGYGIRV